MNEWARNYEFLEDHPGGCPAAAPYPPLTTAQCFDHALYRIGVLSQADGQAYTFRERLAAAVAETTGASYGDALAAVRAVEDLLNVTVDIVGQCLEVVLEVVTNLYSYVWDALALAAAGFSSTMEDLDRALRQLQFEPPPPGTSKPGTSLYWRWKADRRRADEARERHKWHTFHLIRKPIKPPRTGRTRGI